MKKFYLHVVKMDNLRWLRYSVFVCLLTTQSFIVLYYTIPKFEEFIQKGYPFAHNFLSNNSPIAVAIVIICQIIPIAFSELLRMARSNGHDTMHLMMLLGALDEIVGEKLQSINHFYEKAKTNSVNKEHVLSEMINPDFQIDVIVRLITYFFSSLRQHINGSTPPQIHVTLFTMQGNKVIKQICKPINMCDSYSIDQLNDHRSTVQHAIRSKNILVISDIERELMKPPQQRRMIESNIPDRNKGSIIIFPVSTIKGDVPFVLSIEYAEAGYFSESSADIYDAHLKKFALRLDIEYTLKKLKEVMP